MTSYHSHFNVGWFPEKKRLCFCLSVVILIFGSCCNVYGNNGEKVIEDIKDSDVVNDAVKQAGQVRKIRRFWVIRPCAIEWSKDNPKTGEMFVGYSTRWYRFLVPDRIKHVGWNDWTIPGITRFGTGGDNVIYGEMKEEKWFITKPGNGSLPVFFSNRDTWLEELGKLGITDTSKMVTPRDGYYTAQRNIWIGRVAWGGIVAGIVSLPWMIARYLRLRKKIKKRSK